MMPLPERVSRLEGAYEQVADRLIGIDAKLVALDQKIDLRFDLLDAKFGALGSTVDAKIGAVDAKIGALGSAVDAKMAALDKKFDAKATIFLNLLFGQTTVILAAIAAAAFALHR